MKRNLILCIVVLAAMSFMPASAQRQLTVKANKPGAVIQPTMYGIFFEDINFGADGGLYAEMVENRSFEFPDRLMGWNVFGNVQVSDAKPAFDRNPHYVVLGDSGHIEKRTGLENRGFFGMGFKKGLRYDFSVYARLHDAGSKPARIRIELVDSRNGIITRQRININSNDWKKYTASLTPNVTDPKGLMRIFLETAEELKEKGVAITEGRPGERSGRPPSGHLQVPWRLHRRRYGPGNPLPVEKLRRTGGEPSAQ